MRETKAKNVEATGGDINEKHETILVDYVSKQLASCKLVKLTIKKSLVCQKGHRYEGLAAVTTH